MFFNESVNGRENFFKPVDQEELPDDIIDLGDLQPEYLKKNDLEIIEILKRGHKGGKENVATMIRLFSKYENSELFRISNADSVAKSYFCNPELTGYQDEWKNRILELDPHCNIEKLASPFDYLMGLFLRGMHNVFVERGFPDCVKAIELAEAAESRGVAVQYVKQDPPSESMTY